MNGCMNEWMYESLRVYGYDLMNGCMGEWTCMNHKGCMGMTL